MIKDLNISYDLFHFCLITNDILIFKNCKIKGMNIINYST